MSGVIQYVTTVAGATVSSVYEQVPNGAAIFDNEIGNAAATINVSTTGINDTILEFGAPAILKSTGMHDSLLAAGTATFTNAGPGMGTIDGVYVGLQGVPSPNGIADTVTNFATGDIFLIQSVLPNGGFVVGTSTATVSANATDPKSSILAFAKVGGSAFTVDFTGVTAATLTADVAKAATSPVSWVITA